MKQTISVVVPCYNEEETLKITLVTLKRCSWINELIVVDDGSYDKSTIIAEKYCDKLVRMKTNKGKAFALKEGWKRANGDIIVSLDADLGISACEAEELVERLKRDNLDCVIAKLPVQKKSGFGMMKYRAQKLIFAETGQWLDAPLSGQRAFKKKWVPTLTEKEYIGFGVEMAMTIDLLKAGAKIDEVSVNFFHRATGKNLQGFVHRGRQWIDMEKTLWKLRGTWS